MNSPEPIYDEEGRTLPLPRLIAESILVPQMKAHPKATPEEMARRMYKAHHDLFEQALSYLAAKGILQAYHSNAQKQ